VRVGPTSGAVVADSPSLLVCSSCKLPCKMEPSSSERADAAQRDGMIQRCVAYCDPGAKQNGPPINTWATTLWHMSLQRAGYERGLRREDGTIADWLNGTVVVVCSGRNRTPSPG
jgi:hypothetical protein